MFRAEFVTGYLQREIPEIAIVVGDVLRYRELVKVIPATDSYPMIIQKLDVENEASALSAATHIMAQSDMTLFGHANVENRDYSYDDEIAPTVDIDSIEISGSLFKGVFTSAEDFPTDDVSTDDTALLVNTSDSTLDLYAYVTPDDPDDPQEDEGWIKDADFTPIPFADATKFVSVYDIQKRKEDIIVFDE